MVTKQSTVIAQLASDSCPCKHIYLRGNHLEDMFHDKVDKINAWNRLWLSAKATGTIILSAVILDNHFHTATLLKTETQDSEFMHHFRLSLTQYYNRRYHVSGMLGTRKFGRALLRDIDDLKDCICYHIRNVLHHGIFANFMDYQFSTARFVFNLATEVQNGVYTRDTLPQNLAKAYLPKDLELPKGWMMTYEGMIVPPPEVFRADIIESLFFSREEYLMALMRRTTREASDSDIPCALTSDSPTVQTLDEQISEFVKVPIPSMTVRQKIEVIAKVREEYPKVSFRTLERIFGIPASTIRYKLQKITHPGRWPQ